MLWMVETLNRQPHLKSKIQFKDDSLSVSDEEGQEDTPSHQVLGTIHTRLPPWAKRLPILAEFPTGCLPGGL
jgi:hypothetical protein